MHPTRCNVTDPMQRIAGSKDLLPLFDTSRNAGAVAAARVGEMRVKIIRRLRLSPATLWEVARDLGIPDHTISGRFSELAADLLIERTGETRKKPETRCEAHVWKLCRDDVTADEQIELQNYPETLSVDGQVYDRQELLPNEGLPGIPYARRTEGANMGGLRLIIRISMVGCPGCGKPLKSVSECINDQNVTTFSCGTTDCNRRWRPSTVREIGQPGLVSLILRP